MYVFYLISNENYSTVNSCYSGTCYNSKFENGKKNDGNESTSTLTACYNGIFG